MLVNGNHNTDINQTPSSTQTVLNPPATKLSDIFANPGTPAGFLNQNPDDLTFSTNPESGELEIKPKQQIQQQQQVQQTQQQAEEKNPYEERFTRLEQGIATIGSFLEGLKNGGLNNLNGNGSQTQQTPNQTQIEEYDYSGVDVSDPNNIRDIIRNEFKSLIVSELKPLLGKVQENNIRTSFNDASIRFGKEFTEGSLPVISELVKRGILKSDPNMDFVNIHLSLKEQGLIKSVSATDSTIQQSNGSTPNQNGNRQPQTVEALVQKANAISTESPGAQRTIISNANPKKGTKEYTLDDAVNDALAEILG